MHTQSTTQEFKGLLKQYKTFPRRVYVATHLDFEQEFTIKKIEMPMTLKKMSTLFNHEDYKGKIVMLLQKRTRNPVDTTEYLYITQLEYNADGFNDIKIHSFSDYHGCNNHNTKGCAKSAIREKGTAYILIGELVNRVKNYNETFINDVQRGIERTKYKVDRWNSEMYDLVGNTHSITHCFGAIGGKWEYPQPDKSGYLETRNLTIFRLRDYKKQKATRNIKNNIYNKPITELKSKLVQIFNDEKEKINNIYEFSQISTIKDNCYTLETLYDLSKSIQKFENELLQQKDGKIDNEYRLKNDADIQDTIARYSDDIKELTNAS